MSLFSVILPTFNEADTIVSVIEDLLATADAHGLAVELIVVDDRSPDGTAALVGRQFGDEPRVRLHVRDERGLAGAIRRGAELASGEALLFMDTDGNHDPVFVPDLVKTLADADIVVGSRFCADGGMPFSRFRETCSRLFNRWACATLQLPVTDCLSGFLCVRRRLLEDADFDAIFVGYGDYAIHLLYWAARCGARVREVPVVYAARRGGESKTRFIQIFRDYLRTVLHLRHHGLPHKRGR
jgi:dolichol-phosphate mannosyltransferase